MRPTWWSKARLLARPSSRSQRSYGVELPITKAVRSVLWDKASIEETIMTLFDRPLTTEFWGLEHEGAIYAK